MNVTKKFLEKGEKFYLLSEDSPKVTRHMESINKMRELGVNKKLTDLFTQLCRIECRDDDMESHTITHPKVPFEWIYLIDVPKKAYNCLIGNHTRETELRYIPIMSSLYGFICVDLDTHRVVHTDSPHFTTMSDDDVIEISKSEDDFLNEIVLRDSVTDKIVPVK